MNLDLPKGTVPVFLLVMVLIFAQARSRPVVKPDGLGSVYLRTVPSGARISVTQAASIHGVNLKPLGKSPGPLQISLHERSRFTFQVDLSGYHSQTVEFRPEQLVSGEAEVRLRPTLPVLVPALYFVRDNAFSVLALLVFFAYLRCGAMPWMRERRGLELKFPGGLEPGQEFHGYQLLERLGEGGAGVTFLAKRIGSGPERYALKALFDDGKSSPELRVQLEREWKSCLALDHPGLIRMFDWGEIDGTYYLVSEYIDGHPLRPGGVKPIEVCYLMIELVNAITYAHRHGIVHRDLKPDNILLDSAGHPKILDFGVATKIQEAGDGMLGTPGYMAPEQVVGSSEPATDFYALGVIFYELLTGHKPFLGDNIFTLLSKQTQKAYSVASALRPDLPKVCDELIDRLLEPDPKQRLQDSSQVIELLNSCKAAFTSAAE